MGSQIWTDLLFHSDDILESNRQWLLELERAMDFSSLSGYASISAPPRERLAPDIAHQLRPSQIISIIIVTLTAINIDDTQDNCAFIPARRPDCFAQKLTVLPPRRLLKSDSTGEALSHSSRLVLSVSSSSICCTWAGSVSINVSIQR